MLQLGVAQDAIGIIGMDVGGNVVISTPILRNEKKQTVIFGVVKFADGEAQYCHLRKNNRKTQRRKKPDKPPKYAIHRPSRAEKAEKQQVD